MIVIRFGYNTHLSNQFAFGKAQIVIDIPGIDGDFELVVAQEIGDTVHYEGFCKISSYREIEIN